MTKNVLILHSSPRSNSNSSILAKHLHDGAKAAGSSVKMIDIGRADIQPCTACDHCRQHEHDCLIDDRMQDIYPALLWADCIVLASPLYYYTLSAQIKAVIDRFYALDDLLINNKETVLLMTAMDDDPESFAAAEKTYQLAVLNYLGWQDRGRILVGKMDQPQDILGHPSLKQAYQLGLSL
jgi:multimeric flavodoxin WrbA